MYKIFYIKGNPNFEYRYVKGSWQKRAIGTADAWFRADANGQDVLNKALKPKKFNPLWNYSGKVKAGIVVGVLGVGLYLYSSRFKTAINGLR
jgi:hypothetical protein